MIKNLKKNIESKCREMEFIKIYNTEDSHILSEWLTPSCIVRISRGTSGIVVEYVNRSSMIYKENTGIIDEKEFKKTPEFKEFVKVVDRQYKGILIGNDLLKRAESLFRQKMRLIND